MSEKDSDKKFETLSEVLNFSQFNKHSILQDGLVTLESVSSANDFGDGKHASFSYSLSANLVEAAEFSVEMLVRLGHFSVDTDYWIENQQKLFLVDMFDEEPDTTSPQHLLKQQLNEVKKLYDAFEGTPHVGSPFDSSYTIFLELEKLLCDDGNLLSTDWYLARILREFCKPPGGSNQFLIGVLWEQLRVKVAYQDQFKKDLAEKERLRGQSKNKRTPHAPLKTTVSYHRKSGRICTPRSIFGVIQSLYLRPSSVRNILSFKRGYPPS